MLIIILTQSIPIMVNTIIDYLSKEVLVVSERVKDLK